MQIYLGFFFFFFCFVFLGEPEMLAWIPKTWELKNVDLIGFSLFTHIVCAYICVCVCVCVDIYVDIYNTYSIYSL